MGEWKEYKLGDLGTIITGKLLRPKILKIGVMRCCLLLQPIIVIIENTRMIVYENYLILE